MIWVLEIFFNINPVGFVCPRLAADQQNRHGSLDPILNIVLGTRLLELCRCLGDERSRHRLNLYSNVPVGHLASFGISPFHVAINPGIGFRFVPLKAEFLEQVTYEDFTRSTGVLALCDFFGHRKRAPAGNVSSIVALFPNRKMRSLTATGGHADAVCSS